MNTYVIILESSRNSLASYQIFCSLLLVNYNFDFCRRSSVQFSDDLNIYDNPEDQSTNQSDGSDHEDAFVAAVEDLAVKVSDEDSEK